MRRLAVTAAVALAVLAVSVGPVRADRSGGPRGGGGITQESPGAPPVIHSGISVVTPGASSADPGGFASDRPSSTNVLHAETVVSGWCLPDGSMTLRQPPPAGTVEQDLLGQDYVWPEITQRFYVQQIYLIDGTLLREESGCFDPAAGESPPPPPPPPPTAEEVWAAIEDRMPAAAIGKLPYADPVTGLETLLWAEGVGTQTFAVSVTIRGWTAETTARPVRWIWRMGDGTRSHVATSPGRPCTDRTTCAGSVAARHTYERKGDYTIQLDTVWSGDFTLSGYGVTIGSQALGSVTATQLLPVHVVEIRGVLTE